MNKYNIYVELRTINKIEIIAKNEKSARRKISEIAENTDLFSQKIPFVKKYYQINNVELLKKNIK